MNDVQRSTARPLPGPKARALIERDKAVVSPSYVRDYPFVMERGRGAEVWDVDGNRFVDFASGIAVCSTGHSHPDVVAAIKTAAERFLHISCDYWHEAPGRTGRDDCRARSGERAGDVLLRQLRHRGGRSGAETRAPGQRARALHRLPRRLPWPHHGLAGLHGLEVHAAARLFSGDAGRGARAVPESLSSAVRRR